MYHWLYKQLKENYETMMITSIGTTGQDFSVLELIHCYFNFIVNYFNAHGF